MSETFKTTPTTTGTSTTTTGIRRTSEFYPALRVLDAQRRTVRERVPRDRTCFPSAADLAHARRAGTR